MKGTSTSVRAKNMKNRIETQLDWALLAFVSALVFGYGVAVAFRPDEVGADTRNYNAQLENVLAGRDSRFEPFFQMIMSVSGSIGGRELFFFTIYSLIFACYFFAARGIKNNVYSRKQDVFYSALIVGLLFSSSWFINGTINGLRQGLALSLAYLALTQWVMYKRRYLACILSILAVTSHFSAVMIVPLIFLSSVVPVRVAFLCFIIFSLLYAFGVFEEIIYLVPSLHGYDVYAMISTYDSEVIAWYGWQWDLWLYTIGWGLIYKVGSRLVRIENRRAFDTLLTGYLLFSMPYFVLGFGNFSNRFAVLAWAYLPILHFSWVTMSKLNVAIKWVASIGFVLIGMIKFGYHLNAF